MATLAIPSVYAFKLKSPAQCWIKVNIIYRLGILGLDGGECRNGIAQTDHFTAAGDRPSQGSEGGAENIANLIAPSNI